MMNVDLISFFVGVVSSLVAVISVFLVRKTAKNILNDSRIILKNEKGEIREVLVDFNDSKKDYRSYIIDAINYEKSVEKVLKELNLKVDATSINGLDKGFDFLLNSGDKVFAVEVKSHKRPLSTNVIKDILSRIPENIENTLIISKNGFSNSSMEYVKSINKNISLISGENKELQDGILGALQK